MNVIEGNLDIASILDSVEDALTIADAEGRVLFLNAAARNMQSLFYPPMRPGAFYLDSIPPQKRNLIQDIIRTTISNGKPSIAATHYDDRSGRTRHFELKYSPIEDHRGRVTHLFIEAREVTHQKTYENKLLGIAAELSNLIEVANAVIIGIDTQEYVTEWNLASARLTGYSKHEVLAHKFSDMLIDSARRLEFSLAMRNLLQGGEVTNFELPFIAKDRRRLIFLINATPRTNLTGQVIGLLLVGQDISELSEYRESLEAKVKERTEALKVSLENEKKLVQIRNRFVSIASHEFRSPLASIDIAVNWIKSDGKDLESLEVRARLDNVQRQVSNMNAMLEDILTLGKSDAGQLKATWEEVDIYGFFRGIIEEVQLNTRNTHAIDLDVQKEVPQRVLSDEKLLRNIFINLLTNAIKFSPGQKEVSLRVEWAGHSLVTHIRDHGIGIEHVDLQRIFEPFNRGHNAERIKGTGLGLSIVRKAVEALNGLITVESQLGVGTHFKIQFNITHELPDPR